MSRRAQENIVALAFVLVFVGVIVMSMGYGPRARLVPIPVAAIGLILTLIQLVWQNVNAGGDLHVDLLEVLTRQGGAAKVGSDEGGRGAQSPKREEKGRGWREAAAFLLLFGFLATTLVVGPIVAILLLTCGYFMVSRHYSPLKSMLYGVLFTLAVYLLFVVALQVQLYYGVLQLLVDRLS